MRYQIIGTMANPFLLSHSAAATDTSFPSKVPTATEPSGSGVIDLVQTADLGAQAGCRLIASGAMIVPLLTNSDGDAAEMRIIAWTPYFDGKATTNKKVEWVPIPLAELALTAGNIAAGTLGPLAGYFYCDTITLATNWGNDDVSIDVNGVNTEDVVNHVVVDLKGAWKLEITFDLGVGAAGGNALVKLL